VSIRHPVIKPLCINTCIDCVQKIAAAVLCPISHVAFPVSGSRTWCKPSLRYRTSSSVLWPHFLKDKSSSGSSVSNAFKWTLSRDIAIVAKGTVKVHLPCPFAQVHALFGHDSRNWIHEIGKVVMAVGIGCMKLEKSCVVRGNVP
jgi:hypothetical protein